MSVLIDKLSAEIPNWKNVISSIEREDSSGSRSLREGEREVFLELKEFWKYNDFNPIGAKDLINELKKHEPYHAPKWDELGEFRRICVQYYTKDRDAFQAFQSELGGKSQKQEKQDWFDDMIDNLKDGDFPSDPIGSLLLPSNDHEDELVRITFDDINAICQYCESEGVDYYRNNWSDDIKWIKDNFDKLEVYLRYFRLDLYCCYRGWFVEKTGFILFTMINDPNLQLIVCLNENGKSKWEVFSPYLNLFGDSFDDPVIKKIEPWPYKFILEGDYLNKRTLKVFDKIIRYINHKVS